MSELTFTLWPNRYAIVGQVMTSSWEEWKSELSKNRGTNLGKSGLPCVILGRMLEGERRKNKNVQTVEALALDIERKAAFGVEDDPVAYQAKLVKVLEALSDYEYIAYTTYSHTEEDPRIRVIVPLAKAIPPDEYKGAMSYLNCLTGAIADHAAQKLSQPVYLPYHAEDTTEKHWAISHAGKFLDVTTDRAKGVIELRSLLGEGIGRAPRDAYLRQACKMVLLGQAFAEEGNRDECALRIAFHIAKRHKTVERADLETVFRWSVEQMGDDAPHVDNILDKIHRGAEKLEEENIETEEEHEAAQQEDDQETVKAPDGAPYIVQHKAAFYFLKTEGGYSRAHTKEEARAAATKYLKRFQEVKLSYVNTKGQTKKYSIDALVERYGEIPDDVVIDLSVAHSQMRDDIFHEATVKYPTDLKPHYNERINQWLNLLGGERAESLKDWLSLYSDLGRLLSTLVIIGEPNTGKTLLAMGLARRFGSQAPASQGALTGKFQEELIRCPLVYIDEEITENQFDRSFLSAIRSELSKRERSVNRKYLPPLQMMGAIRCLISANHLPFRAQNSSTGQDLKAIAERFHWVRASKAVAEFLAEIPAEEKQRWRTEGIAEHVMYLEKTRTVSEEHRFGVPGDSEKLADLINIGVRWNSWVTEWVCNGVLDRFRKTQSGDPDLKDGAIIADGEVYLRVKTVVKAWETYLPNNHKDPDTRPISEALKGIADGKFKPKDIGVDGNNQLRYYKIRKSPLITWLEETGSGTAEELETALRAGIKVQGNVIHLGNSEDKDSATSLFK